MAAIYFFMWVAFVWGCWSGRVNGENNRCPSACSCLGDYIDCSNMGLIEIPKDLPDWVTDLQIKSNAISTLHNDDFSGLLRLKTINLSNNEIAHVNTTVFTRIPALVKLVINQNKLTEVPRLPGNILLEDLQLMYNNIDTIHMEALSTLRRLDTLDLSCNNLMDIPKGTFPTNLVITKLYLRNNRIFNLEAGCFDNLTSLESLKLNKNAITQIDKHLFDKMTSLRSLDLSRNQLTTLKSLTFTKLKNLQVLKLRRNTISMLSDGVFHGLAKIQTLLLDENELVSVARVWMFGLENLTRLSLSHNKISVIEKNVWEYTPKLDYIDLSDNNIQVIGTTTFSHLTSLSTLLLANNQVKVIQDDAFKAVLSLKELDLNNNTISWTIEGTDGAFRNLSELKRLRLVNNKITTITKQAFMGLANLEQLELQNNNITMVQGNAFEPMPLLRVLKFNTSSLFCDCQLSWLPIWLLEHNFEKSVSAKCQHPNKLKGRNIFVVDSNHFKCDGHFLKPEIVRHPLSQKVLKSENITLNCSAASTEVQGSPTQFQWKKNSELLESARAETENYATRRDNLTHYTSTLRIRGAENGDAGKYQCIISNDFGSAYSKPAIIGVFVFPVFTKTPINVTARATSEALLLCMATGEPKPNISWQKDRGFDSFPAAQERRMYIHPDDDHFYIVNVKAADEGVYTCIAKNEVGTIMANATLTVLQKPAFVKRMEDKLTKAGDTTLLECLSAGSPRPQLTWRLDGRPLTLTQRHFFTAEDQLLLIVETEVRDAGDYTCEMSNTLGTVKGTSTLTVRAGAWGDDGGGGGLDDTSTTTGIIIIAVVCCIVGTSLVWVIIIYQTRKRQELYSATPTDETTLPDEGYLPVDKEGGYGAGGGPLTSTAYQYQLDIQMKESGYESSSGRYREARSAAIFPSEADTEPPSYRLLMADGRYIEQSDENSVSSSRVYPRSETDSLKSENSVSSSRSSQQQTLYTFHPHVTNHDRIAQSSTPPQPDVAQQTCDSHTDDVQCGVQCEHSVSSQTDNSVPSCALCDSDCAGQGTTCGHCSGEGEPRAGCQHHSPPVPPKPSWLQAGSHAGEPLSDGSPSRSGHIGNTELPECVSGYDEELPPPPVATCPNMYIRPDYNHGEPMYVPSGSVVANGTQYVPVYQPVNAPCDCHLRYPRPHLASKPPTSHTDCRGLPPTTNPRSPRQTGIMGCVHHHMNTAWQGHAYTLPYIPGAHIHNVAPAPAQISPRQHMQSSPGNDVSQSPQHEAT